MLSLLGFIMVGLVIVLIMSKHVHITPYIAMVIVPIVVALIGGFGLMPLGTMAMAGITKIMPIAILILFSVLYFGVMLDVGLFDPIISKIQKTVKGDPLKLIIASTFLAMLLATAGDGAITYMITLTAMLPLFKKLGINPLILPTVTLLSVGVVTNIPWSPPTARVIGVLQLDPAHMLTPMLPTMLGGIASVFFVALYCGTRERKRLGIIENVASCEELAAATESEEQKAKDKLKRPQLLWFNAVLTIILLVALVMHLLPQPIIFMLAFAIALMINFPKMEDQKARIIAHAGSVLNIVAIILSAGVFCGILAGTKMTDAMALTLVSLIPDSLGSHLSLITAVLSIPILFIMSIDSYVFGIVPVIAKTAASYGIGALDIGRAAIMGHPMNILSPLVPNIFLLTGLAEVSLADLQGFAWKWALLASVVMIIVAALTGCISV